MADQHERFAILTRDQDGEWMFMPDGPDSPRSTPFIHLSNARHRLEALREKYPERLFLGATVIVQEGWDE